MTPSSSPAPAFGQADLSNCEREQIQLAGSIQPHGALLVVQEPDLVVVQASRNAASFLKIEQDILGNTLRDLGGDLADRIQPHLEDDLDTIPMAVRGNLGDHGTSFDTLIHRLTEGGLVIELEPVGPPITPSENIQDALKSLLPCTSIRSLADATTVVFKDLIGFDRIMVYRFDDEGHGEVYAEEKNRDLEPFLGNRYPASDIPQIARELYIRNRIRTLVDVEYEPTPLDPLLSPTTGMDLDMSLCTLRSMSPIHIQYLKNMGVSATLVASLVVGGKLWGMISCHHYEPRFVHYETRVMCELLSEIIATRIAALESFIQSQAELSVRRLEQNMIETIARDGDWKAALFEKSPRTLLQPLNAGGAALTFEGDVHTAGEVPGTRHLRDIVDWLNAKDMETIFSTASLTTDAPDLAAAADVASGIVAIPVSTTPGEFLIWFRPERIRTVTWGGDPNKPMIIGDDPMDLSPRRSFAQWHQLVEGTSDPWTAADLKAARLIGATVRDVVLQFRSMRLLITQDQMNIVSRQISGSEHPVVIADTSGRILLMNHAFEDLVPLPVRDVNTLDDLAGFFRQPDAIRQSLTDLIDRNRSWRGEVRMKDIDSDGTSLLVRADPVFSAPGRALGYVILFTDRAERHAVETARQSFQESVLEQRRAMTMRLDSNADLVYRDLLSSVIENAQLAALEIADGIDLDEVPTMLGNVRNSVGRTAELLEHLIWHSTREAGDDD